MPEAGNLMSQTSKIRLYEIGPRLTLSLVKIQDALFDGEVLYHMYIQKSTKEISFMRKEKARLLNEKVFEYHVVVTVSIVAYANFFLCGFQ